MVEKTSMIKSSYVLTVPLSLHLIKDQIRYSKGNGWEIHVISSPGELLEEFAVHEGVRIGVVEMPRRITPLRDLVAVFQIWRYLCQIRPQLVHASTPKGGLLGMIAAWLAQVPIRVYQIQGLPFMTATGWKRILLRWTEKISCLLAHQVFVVSPSVRQVIIDEGLCPAA
jgi:hypothetical protein